MVGVQDKSDIKDQANCADPDQIVAGQTDLKLVLDCLSFQIIFILEMRNANDLKTNGQVNSTDPNQTAPFSGAV